MPWQKTDTTHYQLGLPDKGRAIKGLVVCVGCDYVFMHSNKISWSITYSKGIQTDRKIDRQKL